MVSSLTLETEHSVVNVERYHTVAVISFTEALKRLTGRSFPGDRLNKLAGVCEVNLNLIQPQQSKNPYRLHVRTICTAFHRNIGRQPRVLLI